MEYIPADFGSPEFRWEGDGKYHSIHVCYCGGGRDDVKCGAIVQYSKGHVEGLGDWHHETVQVQVIGD